MLILERRVGDEILIADGLIKIVFLQPQRRGRICVGIDAPVDIDIVRPDAKSPQPKDREAASDVE